MRGGNLVIIDYNLKLISKSNEKLRSRFGKYFKSEKFRDFEAHVKSITRAKYPDFELLTGNLSFTVTIYFKNKKHCDVVNAGKSLTDSLEGILYRNDKQILDFHAIVKSENFHKDCFTIFIERY